MLLLLSRKQIVECGTARQVLPCKVVALDRIKCAVDAPTLVEKLGASSMELTKVKKRTKLLSMTNDKRQSRRQ